MSKSITPDQAIRAVSFLERLAKLTDDERTIADDALAVCAEMTHENDGDVRASALLSYVETKHPWLTDRVGRYLATMGAAVQS